MNKWMKKQVIQMIFYCYGANKKYQHFPWVWKKTSKFGFINDFVNDFIKSRGEYPKRVKDRILDEKHETF